jgi:hypothetical protein
MAAKLDKVTVEAIRDFLKDKPGMPHKVCVWCLQRRGIPTSVNTIMTTRKRYEIPYVKDSKIHNAIMFAKDNGIPITHEYLNMKLPHICQEHREYLVGHYAVKAREPLAPFKVGTLASVVHQIMNA